MGNNAEKPEENTETKKEEIEKDEIPPDTQENNEFRENNLNNKNIEENTVQQKIVIMESRGDETNMNQNNMNIQYNIDQQNQVNQPNRRVEYQINQVTNEYELNQDNQEGEEEQENNEEYQINQEQGNEEEYQANQEIQEGEEYEANAEYEENQDNQEYEANQEIQDNQENLESQANEINQQGPSYEINQVRSAMEDDQSYQINQMSQTNQIKPVISESKEYHFNSGDNSYHVKKEYRVEESYQNNQNFSNNNFTQEEFGTAQINPSLRKNIRIPPKESQSKVIIQSTGFYQNFQEGRYFKNYNDIPRYMTFQKSAGKGSSNVRSSLNVVKTENISELIEIPKSEYQNYEGRETIFIGGGMDTGEYKFRGQGVIITQGEVPGGKIAISEEEILKEINRRKNKPRKEKKKKYEVLDRFYAITEFDGKAIKKIEKVEQQQKQYEYEEKQKYYSSSRGNAYQYNSEQAQQSQSQSHSKMQRQNLKYSQNQNYSNNNMDMNINNSNKFRANKIMLSSSPSDNYSKYLFEQINKLREDPQSYIGIIEDAKNNIIKDKHGRLIYNGKMKIGLTDGEAAFDKAINFLKVSKSMEKLEYNPYITVDLPKSENELKYKNDLTLKVENMLKSGISIKSYWRDVIKDPEISFLMMIVDDNGDKSGMRRKDLLDPNMKYIGISSIDINGNFVCYLTLSSEA